MEEKNIDQYRHRLYFDNEDEPQNQTSESKNCIQWWLYDSQTWLRIENDHVIETHYCQPGAKGIMLFTANYGNIFIDFDTMRVQGSHLDVQRKLLLSLNETETVGWYYFDNKHWYEYGTQGTCHYKSSVNSGDIEQKYKTFPQGNFHFTVGAMSYVMDFKEMTQRNLATDMRRQIRRRPKFSCIMKNDLSHVALTQQTQAHLNISPAIGEWKWQFLGDDGQWSDYNQQRCSINSTTIEKHYQQNPQDKVKFIVGAYTYTLHFVGMYQINDTIGTQRAVRRIHNSSNSFNLRYNWQFKDVSGVWMDFRRDRCSVSSEDIETEYQRNSSSTMSFYTERFYYEINFSAMVQKNLTTMTTRAIRRIQL